MTTTVYLIVSGIALVMLALLLIVFDNRKNEDLLTIINERESQLKDTIEESDEILKELNQLYAFISEEFDSKAKDISNISFNIENKHNVLEEKLKGSEEAINKKINLAYEVMDKKMELINDKLNEMKSLITGFERSYDQINNNKKTLLNNLDNMSPVSGEILELHNKGLSIVEIAKKLNKGVGEVQLILNLFKEVR